MSDLRKVVQTSLDKAEYKRSEAYVRKNTDWRGFLTESLSYMNYRGMSWRQRLVFWRRFPGAFYRFYRSKLKDMLAR